MPRYAPPPGADRLSRIRVVPGVAASAGEGKLCSLLLVHDPLEGREDAEAVARDMVGIACGLGLAPQWQHSWRHTRRVILTEGRVLLDYGHAQHILDGPVERFWYDLAAAIGYVRLTVGVDPLPDDRLTDASVYLAAAKARGSLWIGIAPTRVAVRGTG
jgi:hypothetical protein